MFIILFFLLLFNFQLKASDGFNDRMGIKFDVVTVRDLVDFLDHIDANSMDMALSWKATAILLSGSALLGAFSSNQIGSCKYSSWDLDSNNVYFCSGAILGVSVSIVGTVVTGLLKFGAIEKLFNWLDGKSISRGRLLDEAANDNDIREVRYRLMFAESPLLKKLKPDQVLLLVPCFDLFKQCTKKNCFFETSTILATKFIRMVELNKEELINELSDDKVQKEIAEICNEKRFYQMLRRQLPEDKRCGKLEELISKE